MRVALLAVFLFLAATGEGTQAPPASCGVISGVNVPKKAKGWTCTDGKTDGHVVGTICRPTCPFGYLPRGEVRCNDKTTWESTEFPRCIEAACPMKARRTKTLSGIVCKCLDDHFGNLNWNEQEHYWNGTCTGGVCNGNPPSGENGVQMFCGAGSSVGTTCHFGCHDGFELYDYGPDSTCQMNGEWSPLKKDCRKRCQGPAPVPRNGFYRFCSGASTATRTKCSLECAPGWVRTPEKDTFCDAYGNWIPGKASCIPEAGRCGATPPVPPGGHFTGENCTRNIAVEDGASCPLECNEYFRKTKNGTEAFCMKGSWVPATYRCVQEKCTDMPPSIPNGVLTRCAPGSLSGTKCRLKCFRPYKRVLGDAVTCQVDGTWSTTGLYSCSLSRAVPSNSTTTVTTTTTTTHAAATTVAKAP